jgi:hypothetical protein
VLFPDFQPMKVSEKPVCIYLFRHNTVFTSLRMRSPVRVVPLQGMGCGKKMGASELRDTAGHCRTGLRGEKGTRDMEQNDLSLTDCWLT